MKPTLVTFSRNTGKIYPLTDQKIDKKAIDTMNGLIDHMGLEIKKATVKEIDGIQIVYLTNPSNPI